MADLRDADFFAEVLGGGPTRTRTWNQRIHVAQDFRLGVDYLITLSRAGRVRDARACH